jgi:cytochrome c553
MPVEYADRQFKHLRCASCHEREDAQDVWSAVEALTAAAAPKPVNPYDDGDEAAAATVHRRRPPLTLAGEKLRPEWMMELFGGQLSYKTRPKLEARMPVFTQHSAGLAMGLAMQHGCEVVSPALPPVRTELVPTGQALAQKGALACVDCHAVGEQPALAGTDMVTINFAYIPQRLRPEYFERYARDPSRALPGTMMPRFIDDDGRTGVTAHFEGDGARQFEAIWNFMRTVKPPK